jgi:hypothetical protein
MLRQFPPSIDPGASYLLYFPDALAADIVPGAAVVAGGWPPRPYSSVVRGLMPATMLAVPPPRTESARAQADSAVARIGVLLAAGVRPERVVIAGSGRGAAIVMAVASAVSANVRYVVAGSCGGLPPGPRRANVFFEAVPPNTPEADRCGSRFDASAESRTVRMPAGANMTEFDGAVDWIDAAYLWVTAVTAGGAR